MLDTILGLLRPQTVVIGLLVFAPLLALALKYPELALGLNMAVWLFAGALKGAVPLSVSAISALCTALALFGAFLRGHQFHWSRDIAAFLALVLLMLVSLGYTKSREYGIEKVTLFVFLSLPVILGVSYTAQTASSLERLVSLLTLVSCLYIVISFAFMLTQDSMSGRWTFFSDVITSSRVYMLGFLLCIYWWWPRRALGKIVTIVIGFLSIYLSIVSGTRTALVAFLLAIILVSLLGSRKANAIKPTVVLFIFVLLSFAILSFPSLRNLVPEDVLETRFSGWQAFFAIDQLENPRYRILNYTIAWNSALRFPLGGLGAGGFKAAMAPYSLSARSDTFGRQAVYPHNIFLEFLSEQGFPGLVLFSVCVYFCFRSIFMIKSLYRYLPFSYQTLSNVSIVFFLYGLIIAQTSLDIPRQQILWWGFGLLVAVVSNLKKENCTNELCPVDKNKAARRHPRLLRLLRNNPAKAGFR